APPARPAAGRSREPGVWRLVLDVVPDGPRRTAALVERLEVVLVLQGVERRPEAVVRICDELAALDQAREGLLDQILVLADVVEDLAAEEEVAAVDADRRVRHRLDPVDEVAVGERDEVERVARR